MSWVFLSLLVKFDWISETSCSISTESCTGRCGSFDPQTKCQCDSMCVYYRSCCRDFYTICPRKSQCGKSNFDWVQAVFKNDTIACSCVLLSCSRRHVWRSGGDESHHDPQTLCEHSRTHGLRPRLRPHVHLHDPGWRWRSGLQRSTFRCLSAAEEWVDLRL